MSRSALGRVPLRLQQQAYRVLPAPVWRLVRDAGYGATPLQRRVRAARLQRMEEGAARAFDVPVAAVDYRGERFLARPVDRFQAHEVLARNADLVLDALERAGIAHFVVDAASQRRRVVAVAERDRAVVAAALDRGAQGMPLYVNALQPGRRAGRRKAGSARPGFSALLDGGRAYSIFGVYAAAGSEEALCGPELGCELEFWTVLDDDIDADRVGEPLAAGSWVAPRRNRWADAVPASMCQPVRRTIDGTTRASLPTLSERHLLDVDFPIDAVYTWVDGSDEAWRERKATAHAAVGLGELNEFANNESRFLSRDELRYSLRSLDMYAGWVRHVYLVTDRQVPPWLDLSNSRITVVDHRDLFGDRGQLPTFNSHAIESQLHHIPGLSEHYVYLNDDVFFGRPVGPGMFFHGNGLAKFHLSTAKLGLGDTGPFDRPVMSGGKNNRDLLFKAFDRTIANKFKHVPHTQRRDVLLELEERFADEFAETAGHQFRDPADVSIAASLHHYYAYLTGRAVEGRMRYFYADIAAPQTAGQLRRMLRSRNYDAFCLNDHDSSGLDPLVQQHMLHDFLSRYFPLPSSFEK